MNDKAVLLHGDCLEMLKQLPDNSVDSLVTDPPAFIDFMGKSWDGTDLLWKYLWSNNTYVKNVEIFLSRMKVENFTVELNTVHGSVDPEIKNKRLDQQGDALYANKRLTLVNPENKGSVDLLVLTKLELLDLLNASLGSLTISSEKFLAGDDTAASYVIPLILPNAGPTNTVPNSVLTNIKKLSKSGKKIPLTSMVVARIRDSIEDRIGIRLEEKFSSETTTPANAAKNPTSAELYNVTTLYLTDSREIIPNLTLLLSALVVTEKSKNIQGYLASNFMECVMTECLRVLKPGAHGLVWAIPRTAHWTMQALEEAGFDIRDVVVHVFGSGFPKSLDISKAIDKAAGAEREVVGPQLRPDGSFRTNTKKSEGNSFTVGSNDKMNTPPSTPDAKKWAGFGTALKPASEHWILVRKPISEKTVAANVLQHGTGGINIDASRIGLKDGDKKGEGGELKGNYQSMGMFGSAQNNVINSSQGRFPANFILSHNPDCVEMEDGTETVAAFECTAGCAVAELDRQSGTAKPARTGKRGGSNPAFMSKEKGDNAHQDSEGYWPEDNGGGASRFFYIAKASKKDKNSGLPEGEHSTHPTVKSSGLMTYLIKLITPPGGIVLDPFMGSGSTGVAATKAGFDFIGIEKEEEYFNISQKRVG